MKKLNEWLVGLFHALPADKIADKELAQAKRELLSAESHREYWQRIAEYQKDRIRRLNGILASGELL